jgi:hypothetical protein
MYMFAETHALLAIDLRFALEVMEDRSHLGLNAERAASLRALIRRKISDADKASQRTVQAVPIATYRKKLVSA